MKDRTFRVVLFTVLIGSVVAVALALLWALFIGEPDLGFRMPGE